MIHGRQGVRNSFFAMIVVIIESQYQNYFQNVA